MHKHHVLREESWEEAEAAQPQCCDAAEELQMQLGGVLKEVQP